MATTIYFYTGTGNSLWAAKKLSAALGETQLTPISRTTDEKIIALSENVGFVFPVHIWGVPPPVVNFIKRVEADPTKYYFAMAVHAGQVAASLLQLRKLLNQKDLKLSLGFSLCMPNNYIPLGSAPPPNQQKKLFDAATLKIKRVSTLIQKKQEITPERGPSWQNLLFTFLYNKTYSKVPKMDKPFKVDPHCTGCEICSKICPAQNIKLVNGKPLWQHRCEQCFACIHWCPENAIQYDGLTSNKKRYHHPEITLKEMLSWQSSTELQKSCDDG